MKKLELHSFKKYIQDRASQGTAVVYMYALQRWIDWLNGRVPNAQSAQEYVDYLASAGKSASTVNLRAHAIMRYLKWRGTPIDLECPTIRMGEIKYLLIRQVEELLAACTNLLERVLTTVLFDTAVRVSELLNLEVGDIDYEHKFISVVRKGGMREEVNISDKALAVLDEWLEARSSDQKRVFMGLSYYDAWVIIKNVGKRIGVDMHPHMLRHSRAIQMLLSGATLHDVKGHLGHKSITTTANIYGRFKAADLRERIPAW